MDCSILFEGQNLWPMTEYKYRGKHLRWKCHTAHAITREYQHLPLNRHALANKIDGAAEHNPNNQLGISHMRYWRELKSQCFYMHYLQKFNISKTLNSSSWLKFLNGYLSKPKYGNTYLSCSQIKPHLLVLNSTMPINNGSQRKIPH